MRIAVISDVHANLLALDAVLAQAGSVDAIWHLGDIVGYGPEPDAVVERLASVGALGVRGNHDAAACGGTEIDWFNPDARSAMEWTREVISDRTRSWLPALPERREEADFTLVHGSATRSDLGVRDDGRRRSREPRRHDDEARRQRSYPHPRRLPRSRRPDRAAWDQMAARRDATGRLDGHRLLLNPGSVGQPRDGDPRASYLILDTDAQTATWQRVAYDVAAVGAAMRAAGLPARLAERLRHGF